MDSSQSVVSGVPEDPFKGLIIQRHYLTFPTMLTLALMVQKTNDALEGITRSGTHR